MMVARVLEDRPISLQEAVGLQKRLSGEVIEADLLGEVNFIAGVDLSGVRGSGNATAAAVLLTFPDLRVVEQRTVEGPLRFPYLPGFLSFREAPLMVESLQALSTRPDLVLVDGQGRAHPRGLGIACHLGLLLDLPTIGCAKSRLVGQFEPPGEQAGERSPLVYRGKTVGVVLRSKSGVKPLFVSVGHKVSLPTATELVLRCTLPRQRLPEPTRQAHLVAGRKPELGGTER